MNLNPVLEVPVYSGPTVIGLERSTYPSEMTGVVPARFEISYFDFRTCLTIIITGVDRLNDDGSDWIIRGHPDITTKKDIGRILGWHHEDDRGLCVEMRYNTRTKKGMLKIYEIPSR